MQLMLPIYRNLLVSVLLLFHFYILHVIIICNLLNRIQLKTWSWNHSFYPLIRWKSNDNYQHIRSYLQISWIKRKTKFVLSFPICSILTVIKITIFLDTLIRKQTMEQYLSKVEDFLPVVHIDFRVFFLESEKSRILSQKWNFEQMKKMLFYEFKRGHWWV